jgi:hypothetical protein
LVYGVCNLWRKVEFLRALDFKLIIQYLFREELSAGRPAKQNNNRESGR